MTAFATLDDYSKRVLGQPTDAQTNEQVQAALDSACAEIRTYCAQLFDLTEDDTITVHGTGKSTLLLPELPVVAVNSITIDAGLSTELAVTDFRTETAAGVLWRQPSATTGPCWHPTAFWPLGFLNITVNYDHGYATIPDDLIDVAVAYAREKVNLAPSRLRGETITNYSYTQDGGIVTLETFATILEDYRQKRVPVP